MVLKLIMPIITLALTYLFFAPCIIAKVVTKIVIAPIKITGIILAKITFMMPTISAIITVLFHFVCSTLQFVGSIFFLVLAIPAVLFSMLVGRPSATPSEDGEAKMSSSTVLDMIDIPFVRGTKQV